MIKMGFPVVLVIFCLIVALGAGIVAADKMGAIDIKTVLAGTFNGIPLIANNLSPEAAGKIERNIPGSSPLEEENKALLLKIKDIESKVLALEKEKTASILQVEAMQQELLDLQNYKQANEKRLIEAQELAGYYRQMKPDAAVKVMEKLDDDTVILILSFFEDEQAAKILSLLNPQRAALITQMLLGSERAGEG